MAVPRTCGVSQTRRGSQGYRRKESPPLGRDPRAEGIEVTSADKIVALLSHLNDDETTVLLRITERLVIGRKQYGALDVATDRRDWTKEANEEALDLAVYLAIKTVGR